MRRALAIEAAKTPLLAFVISRSGYYNSIFGTTNAVHLRPLQAVVNAAARLIVQRRKDNHIKDSIRDELHWLPVPYRLTQTVHTRL